MKTIEEHLNTLISPIREMALRNRKDYPFIPPNKKTTVDFFLGDAFFWKITPEGHDFWKFITINIHKFIKPQQPEVTPQVIVDLQERSKKGEAEYGTTLRTNNGRNALQDAYEEALDLACYLKQKLMEDGD